MIEERQLSAVLGEFARTMLTDFPIQAILDRLVQRIVDVLPVTAAGVTLIGADSKPHYVAASSDGALELEKMQTALGLGPCVVAYRTGQMVSVPDFRADSDYPEFSSVAQGAGLLASFAFPMRHNEGQLGALDLFRSTPGHLDDEDIAAAQTLADVAAAYLLNARAREEAIEVSEHFRHSSLHDPLTGLANRALLQQRLEHAAERARRSHAKAAVLFADLNDFKQVNDIHGHAVGDALLVAVGQRLSRLLRPGDTLARVSGDEFVILCEDLAASADVRALAQRVDDAFIAPFALSGSLAAEGSVEVRISASVGMAFAGRADDIGPGLVRDADMAMYEAKRAGHRTGDVLDLRATGGAAARVQLARDMRDALDRQDLTLVYQPIVHPSDRRLTGVEALLRWNHPVRGAIPPEAMIATAERTSLIVELGAWVLYMACTDRMRWLAEHPDTPLDVAVNVSARELMVPGYRESLARTLQRTGMDPAALVLEMTEGILVDDAESVVSVLTDLKRLGVRLALDDFGTGYSSLNYLQRFPVDIVKIDKSFTTDIGDQQPRGSAIISAVTDLAHALSMSVTAEGVETRQQHAGVVRLGCDSAQGFYYSLPLNRDLLGCHLEREHLAAGSGAPTAD